MALQEQQNASRLPHFVELIRAIEAEIPAKYRVEVFRALTTPITSPPDLPRAHEPPRPEAAPLVPASAAIRSRLNLSSYAGVLAAPGRTLLKALVGLNATASQLGVDWMTPSEIERFLVDRARVPHVYRTNISNALRGARQLVDRRRRGRGYEYRITLTGREALEREQKVLGG